MRLSQTYLDHDALPLVFRPQSIRKVLHKYLDMVGTHNTGSNISAMTSERKTISTFVAEYTLRRCTGNMEAAEEMFTTTPCFLQVAYKTLMEGSVR